MPETLDLSLSDRIATLRADEPRLRARDIAQRLGISEAELVAAGCGCGDVTIRLAPRWADLLRGLEGLGPVMALTRNDHVVHERHGTYRNIEINGQQALVLDEGIDLRIFLTRWHHAFAVQEGAADKPRLSIQIFDADGTAVHKIYVTDRTDRSAYAALVAAFRAEDQSPCLTVTAKPAPAADRPDEEVDVAAFRSAWDGLQDTHDFFPLLRKFGLGRTQALRLGGAGRAEAIGTDAPRRVLELAAARQVPIMVFVGSPGVIQIHTGPVSRIEPAGPWINVLDPEFNLHLREDAVAGAWVVRKPTQDGTVTSVEIFDAAGGTMALFFGRRKPGQPEDPAWRELVAALSPMREAA